MQSLAIFPCACTDGARMIGELSNFLELSVYTDAMLFADVEEQFGVSAEELAEVIYGKAPLLRRYILRKVKYINLLKCSLEALRTESPRKRLFYGFHISLLNSRAGGVLKMLVFDDLSSRIQRAVHQEGLRQDTAERYIAEHDATVSGWTGFLFHKKPYDQSLYDVVIEYGGRDFFDVINLAIRHYRGNGRPRRCRQVADKASLRSGVWYTRVENSSNALP